MTQSCSKDIVHEVGEKIPIFLFGYLKASAKLQRAVLFAIQVRPTIERGLGKSSKLFEIWRR